MIAPSEPIELWEGVAPGSESWTHHEQPVVLTWGGAGEMVRNVVVPTVAAYLPEEPAARPVLVCPGGAMYFLSMQSEGTDVAKFLSARGIAAFVLKYRLVPTSLADDAFEQELIGSFGSGLEAAMRSAVPLAAADAERAVDLVRDHGFEHVTMLGFSAGAAVTAEVIALCQGIVRTGHGRMEPRAPGAVDHHEIELWPTSVLFRAGHRIRLDISSSEFPTFDLNPNTGERITRDGSGRTVTATQKIFHDAQHPSRLVLPVIPR